MTWKCAECQVVEDSSNPVDVVCHHCGKPLCKQDRRAILDPAFERTDHGVAQEAFHCTECAERDHPAAARRARYLLRWLR